MILTKIMPAKRWIFLVHTEVMQMQIDKKSIKTPQDKWAKGIMIRQWTEEEPQSIAYTWKLRLDAVTKHYLKAKCHLHPKNWQKIF